MDIDFASLGLVAGVSLAAGVVVVAIFALGVRAWSLREGGQDGGSGATGASRPAVLPTIAAVLCFAACALIVLYGIYLIVPQLSG